MEPFAQSYRKYRRIIAHTGGVSYDARQLRTIYNFPPMTGKGKVIGFIELGGGFIQSDLDAYRSGLGLPPGLPIEFVSISGAQNSPTTPDTADGEVMLDLCVAAGLAPDAQLVVYMAPNTDQDFAGAIAQAVKDGVDCISISWGAAEQNWTTPALNAMTKALTDAQAKGITVTAAAGDNGSGDGLPGKNVDFPASSAHILGCGGTTLTQASATGRTEAVWNNGGNGGATGGGISARFTIPTWQAKANVPGGTMRGVPDIAAVADPETGIMIRVDGQTLVLGGTSAVSPFMAAMIACFNEGFGKKLGFINPLIYAMLDGPPVFKDITTGNNGTYMARPLYDCCTGLGTPFADKLYAALGGGTLPTLPGGNGGTVTLSQPIKVNATITVPIGTYPTA